MIRAWARRAAFLVCIACFAATTGAAAAQSAQPAWGHSMVVTTPGGDQEFDVDGKPFFVWGASFFYERLPRAEWANSFAWFETLGYNTIDLYLPWNWHELSDGDFDFDGHTNERRDLRALIALIKRSNFKVILRPGPVIRNEWRNGGYPAWLLERPEYGMAQHELLEGRYPATATLQNAHSDDAAAEWMNNATHMRYASRWMTTVLREFAPVADRVIAVQLDDDQAAYIDNQTYPAPHLHAYLEWLRSVVHSVTGPSVPVYINTYQPKVPGSLPVWEWGNWYQGGSYQLGEHDLNDLEFSTLLLQTQQHGPVMQSEFQAGWLAAPEDQQPRPSAPSSTTLALYKLLALGVKGIVDFPPQDTLAPAGWEAPFTNWFYAWDAAVPYEPGSPQNDAVLGSPRYLPTDTFGGMIDGLGSQIATAHRVADGAIAYTLSLSNSVTSERLQTVVNKTQSELERCSAEGLVCDLVDLRFIQSTQLAKYSFLVIPETLSDKNASDADHAYRKAINAFLTIHPHRVFTSVPRGVQPRSHSKYAIEVRSDRGGRFLIITNPSDRLIRVGTITVAPFDSAIIPSNVSLASFAGGFSSTDRIISSTCILTVAKLRTPTAQTSSFLNFSSSSTGMDSSDGSTGCDMVVSLHGQKIRRHIHDWAHLHPSGFSREMVDLGNDQRRPFVDAVPMGANLVLHEPLLHDVSSGAVIAKFDLLRDGSKPIIMQNRFVRIGIDPDAGARAFLFEDLASKRSVFNMTGALRDDVARQMNISKRDYIAAYTHSYPAGTFNRPYTAEILESGKRAVVRFTYDMPDALPHGARFEKTLTLEPDARQFSVNERVTFPGDDPANPQHGVSLASLTAGEGAPADWVTITAPSGLGVYDPKAKTLATVTWSPAHMEGEELKPYRSSITLFMRYAPDTAAETRYGVFHAETEADARKQFADVIGVGKAAWRGTGAGGPNQASLRGSGGMADAVASKATE